MLTTLLASLLLGCVKGLPDGPKFFTGLIPDPNAKNTPEEIGRLNQIYETARNIYIPNSFDAREHGK